jgi:hypothetical protein
MTRRKAAVALAAAGALALTALPVASAGADTVVCNEAQSSWQGTWDATSSADAVPPAFHKDAAMPVGSGRGLDMAAERSPALAVCVAEDDDGGGDTIT